MVTSSQSFKFIERKVLLEVFVCSVQSFVWENKEIDDGFVHIVGVMKFKDDFLLYYRKRITFMCLNFTI